MNPELTPEQREAIKEHPGAPVYVVDSETQAKYVLLPADAYERIRALFDDEPFDVREAYPAIDEITGKAGWDDPAMDVYNNYDTDKPKS